jgi:hypothetical protein
MSETESEWLGGGADRSISRRHRHDDLEVGARPQACLSHRERHPWPKILEPQRYRCVDASHGHLQGDGHRESRRRLPMKGR